MSKVTSKLQVTLPKALADRFGIQPGAEIEWEAAGDVIRVLPPAAVPAQADQKQRLRMFDAATRRQQERQAHRPFAVVREGGGDRGWTREELYRRGGSAGSD